jgi:hypothetical protein
LLHAERSVLLSKSTPTRRLRISPQTLPALSLARSVIPMLGPLVDSSEELLHMVDSMLVGGGHVNEGDEVVVVASLPVQAAGTTNFLKLHRVGSRRVLMGAIDGGGGRGAGRDRASIRLTRCRDAGVSAAVYERAWSRPKRRYRAAYPVIVGRGELGWRAA